MHKCNNIQQHRLANRQAQLKLNLSSYLFLTLLCVLFLSCSLVVSYTHVYSNIHVMYYAYTPSTETCSHKPNTSQMVYQHAWTKAHTHAQTLVCVKSHIIMRTYMHIYLSISYECNNIQLHRLARTNLYTLKFDTLTS